MVDNSIAFEHSQKSARNVKNAHDMRETAFFFKKNWKTQKYKGTPMGIIKPRLPPSAALGQAQQQRLARRKETRSRVAPPQNRTRALKVRGAIRPKGAKMHAFMRSRAALGGVPGVDLSPGSGPGNFSAKTLFPRPSNRSGNQFQARRRQDPGAHKGGSPYGRQVVPEHRFKLREGDSVAYIGRGEHRKARGTVAEVRKKKKKTGGPFLARWACSRLPFIFSR
jgi:hypothetical protein